jgi:hypothetical protein
MKKKQKLRKKEGRKPKERKHGGAHSINQYASKTAIIYGKQCLNSKIATLEGL